MNGRAIGALAALVVLVGVPALAQNEQPAGSAAAPAPAAAPAAPSSGEATAPAATPASAPASTAPAASAVPARSGKADVTGYAYNTHPKSAAPSAPVHHARMAHHVGDAVAKRAGFEMLADGGSRLFVQLTRAVEVEQSKEAADEGHAPARKSKRAHAASNPPASRATGKLVFLLKGAEISHHNDGNALETLHFNTPILRARLVPAGKDLRLVVVMRADVTPTVTSVPAKDNGSVVQIDFAQGSYLPPGDSLVTPESAGKEPVQGALPSNDAPPAEGSGPQQ